MRGALLLLSLLALFAAALAGGDDAVAGQAEQLRPIDLRVWGGEDAWHADNDFRLDWDRPPVADQGFPVLAVGYRVRDAAGAILVPEVRLPWETTQIEHLRVPSGPGVYTADVWLEGPDGQRGPESSATLRFDDVRPGPAQPQPAEGWFAGNAASLVRIAPPPGTPPISGIRGYAVSIDRGAGSEPCAGPDRCSLAETDLRGADTISLGVLPEGANVVRAVTVSGAGMRSAETRSAIVRVDATRAEMALLGAPDGWADGPVRLTALASDALSGMSPSGPGGPYTAISVDGDVPRVELGASASVVVAGDGLHRVAFYARDAAGNSGEQSPRLAAVRIDQTPPQVAFARAQDPTEPERIVAAVADSLAGADQQRGSIAVRPAGSRQRFVALPTTVSEGRLLARWNSDAFAAGSYEFRATGYDLAGNAGVSDRRENGTRMVLANPLKTPTAIETGFGETRSSPVRARTVPHGRGVSFGGRLTSAAGAPLAGFPVEIVESFDHGSDLPRRTSIVQTGRDGTFLLRLQPGPSRDVEAVFAGDRTLSRASDRSHRLAVRAGVRLRASSGSARIGGTPVVFSGSVVCRGARRQSERRSVELQFRLAGGTWSEFRTVQTDPRGRFRYPYAFSDDDSRGIRFQFRAYLAAPDAKPYEPAASRPVLVTGR